MRAISSKTSSPATSSPGWKSESSFEAEGPNGTPVILNVKISERRGNGGAGAVQSQTAVMEPVLWNITANLPRKRLSTSSKRGRAAAGYGHRDAGALPTNCPGKGQLQYRQKQEELRDAGVSLVEIDLLRRESVC